MALGTFSGGGLGFGLAFTLQDQFTGTAQQIQKQMQVLGGSADQAQTRVNSALDQMTLGATALAASAAVLAPVALGVGIAAEFEKYQTSLTTLLKSSEKAAAVFENIKKDAAATPFDTQSLLAGNVALISTGLGAEKARADVLALANAVAGAGGGSVELQRMVFNLQQIRNLGKASAIDIKQFGIAGINIYQLLADYTGKTLTEVKDMEISYETLTGALAAAGKEGGLYFNAMANMSQTASGKMSTLGDNVKFALAGLGQAVFPIFHALIDFGIQFFEVMQRFTQSPFGAWVVRITAVLAALVAALGALAFIMGITRLVAYQMANAFGEATRATIQQTIATRGAAAGFRAMAVAAAAALVPMLPMVATVGALFGVLIGLYKLVVNSAEAFDTMKKKGEGWGLWMQKLGGYVTVIKEVWQTWNNLRNEFTLTGETVAKLKDLGIYDTALGIATWTLRIKEFFSGVWEGMVEGATAIKDVVVAAWEWMSKTISGIMEGLGFEVNKNKSDVKSWASTGKVVGYIIIGVLAAMAIAFIAMGVSAIVALIPVIAIIALIVLALYALYYVFSTVWGWIKTFAGWVYSIYEIGRDFVIWLWEGISSTIYNMITWLDETIESIPIIGWIYKGAKWLVGKAFELGKSIITGLWSGLKSVMYSMITWLDETIESIPILGSIYGTMKAPTMELINKGTQQVSTSILADIAGKTPEEQAAALANFDEKMGTNLATEAAKYQGQTAGGLTPAEVALAVKAGLDVTKLQKIENIIYLDGEQLNAKVNEISNKNAERED